VGHDLAPNSQRTAASRPEGSDEPDLDADSLVERFAAFFAGEDPALDDVPIDLSWATPFQHDVAVTLRAVPRGEIVSYGELAALAGYPRAGRAAGGFCAHNRHMLLVPCHRVVGATGLGGYGTAGLGVKRRLLELEGVHL
jgi:methylated-DNA-[protein]-cysteine S-methyltransferase